MNSLSVINKETQSVTQGESTRNSMRTRRSKRGYKKGGGNKRTKIGELRKKEKGSVRSRSNRELMRSNRGDNRPIHLPQ